MTVQDATAKTIPWLRYSREVDAQLARKTNPAQVAAAYQAYLAGQAAPRTINGAPSYRDAGSPERYTVGYGGERTYDTPARTSTVKGLSDKQKDLVDKLLVEKVHTYTEAEVVEAKADWRKGRVMIDTLIAAARKPYQAPAAPVQAPARERFDFNSVPDGNYAYYEGDEANDLVKFFRVDTNGTWKNLAARGGDTLYPVKNTSAKVAIMRHILEVGLDECRMLFVRKLDRCWMCGRHLTNDESRARGLGPDCAAK